MENAAKHFDVDQHREFPAFRQSPQTPQVTRGCFLLPAKGRDLWENPSPAPGTWHAWKYIWREGRISIWKKELTSEEAGRLQHDTNMKSTFMNMDWVGEPRNTYFHICKCRFILHAGQMLKGLQVLPAETCSSLLGMLLGCCTKLRPYGWGHICRFPPKKHCVSQIPLWG